MRSTSATSLNSISAAPNVTISSSGELPLPVRQAMSAAHTGQTGSTTSATSVPTQLVTTTPAAKAAAATVSVTHPVGTTGAPPTSAKLPVKQVKLGLPGKPQGIDPMIIMKERENRFGNYAC